MTPAEQLAADQRARPRAGGRAVPRAGATRSRPALERAGVRVAARRRSSRPSRRPQLSTATSRSEVFPILTPIAIDPGHPFPHARATRASTSASCCTARSEQVTKRETVLGVVQVPTVLPRLSEVVPDAAPSGARRAFVLLEDLDRAARRRRSSRASASSGCTPFRVTRNFDLEIDEEEADDLLQTIQQELRRRERGNAVRLEVARDAPAELVDASCAPCCDLDERDVYRVDGPLHLADLGALARPRDERRDLRDEPFTPQVVPPLREADDIFARHRASATSSCITRTSRSSTSSSSSREAADDPNVLAIKQTLYRAGGDSPDRAGARPRGRERQAGHGARRAQGALRRGVEHPVGAHARGGGRARRLRPPRAQDARKVSLVVRREARQASGATSTSSTGNYNPTTARLYTDLSLFTARDAYRRGRVVRSSTCSRATRAPPTWKRFIVAPLGLHERILGLIERETEHARAGRPARIVAKMNSLVDATSSRRSTARRRRACRSTSSCAASAACARACPASSENIRVISVVDRFLEHARIFYFENGGKREVYLSSADWMPRNFHRRVEVMFPIDDEDAARRASSTRSSPSRCADNVKARRLLADGTYVRVRPEGDAAARAQPVPLHGARAREGAGRARPSRARAAVPIRCARRRRRAACPRPGAKRPSPTPAVVVPSRTPEGRPTSNLSNLGVLPLYLLAMSFETSLGDRVSAFCSAAAVVVGAGPSSAARTRRSSSPSTCRRWSSAPITWPSSTSRP